VPLPGVLFSFFGAMLDGWVCEFVLGHNAWPPTCGAVIQVYRIVFSWHSVAKGAATERRTMRKAALVDMFFRRRSAWRRWRGMQKRRALLRRVFSRMEAAWEVTPLPSPPLLLLRPRRFAYLCTV
jgi:hypothetical protein